MVVLTLNWPSDLDDVGVITSRLGNLHIYIYIYIFVLLYIFVYLLYIIYCVLCII